MTITDKDMDRYYLNRFNIYKKDYDRAFNYANKNWFKLVQNASTTHTRNPIPISSQIARACHVPESVGAEIANSISLSRGL